MTEKLRKTLRDSKMARWTVLVIVSLAMFSGYYIVDVMAPLMSELQETFGWDATEFGILGMSYGFLNVAFFMMIIGGMILDKLGIRITGIGACALMIVGAGIKYYAVSQGVDDFAGEVFGIMSMQVFIASVGFAIFGVGLGIAGITLIKVTVRWFKGYELGLALAIQLAISRLATALVMATTTSITNHFGDLSAPVLLGLIGLCVGLVAYLIFCVMDVKLSASGVNEEEEQEEPFRLSDVRFVVKNKGFWLITFLCLLYYSALFPFLRYAVSLMEHKYAVSRDLTMMLPFGREFTNFDLAGTIVAMMPFVTMLLTPLFGAFYDKKGKGATIMLIGAALLTVVHLLLAAPFLNVWWFALFLMIVLGISFSLVPAAMWPAVPKIIPENLLGTAFALMFWVQGIGLTLVPFLIGWVLDSACCMTIAADGSIQYDYTIPMLIFAAFGILALVFAQWLKKEDRKKGYGLEMPNMKQ